MMLWGMCIVEYIVFVTQENKYISWAIMSLALIMLIPMPFGSSTSIYIQSQRLVIIRPVTLRNHTINVGKNYV